MSVALHGFEKIQRGKSKGNNPHVSQYEHNVWSFLGIKKKISLNAPGILSLLEVFEKTPLILHEDAKMLFHTHGKEKS